jgi:hypothetical protein
LGGLPFFSASGLGRIDKPWRWRRLWQQRLDLVLVQNKRLVNPRHTRKAIEQSGRAIRVRKVRIIPSWPFLAKKVRVRLEKLAHSQKSKREGARKEISKKKSKKGKTQTRKKL